MDTSWYPRTPSGSRASPGYSHWDIGDAMSINDETRDDGFDHDDDEDDADHFSYIGTHSMMNSGILPPGVMMTPKIPPSFNGRTNWFQYESKVKEWVNTYAIPADRQG